MTIYNVNPTEQKIDQTLQQLGVTLQSLNNHLNNIKPVQQTLNSGDRYLARKELAAKGDTVFGEMALAGLGSFTGVDVLESITNMGGGLGDMLMEAAQELHELDGKNNITDLEKVMRLRRRRAYEEELRQERQHETESRKLKTMMTLMAMAVGTLEERVNRREKREAKRSTMKAFAQNNKAIALKKARAKSKKRNILEMNTRDIVMEAA